MQRKTRTAPRLLRALGAAVVTLAALAPAAQAQTSDPFAALPESDVVFVVDVHRALTEVVPRVLASDQKTLVQMNTGIDGLKALTGVDLRAARRLVVGLRGFSPQMKAENLQAVAVLEGLDTAKLLAFLQTAKKGQYREQDYQGTTVYTILTDNDKPINPNVEFAALDGTTLIAGTPAELRAGLDARAGRGARANADLVSAASRHTDAVLSVALVVPESLKQMIANSGTRSGGSSDPTSQMIGQALAAVTMVNLAVGLTPNGYNGFVSARLDTGDRAKSLSDMLEGLKTLALMEPPKDERGKMLHSILRATLVSAQGQEVQIKTEVAQADITSFIASRQKSTVSVAATPSAVAPVQKATPRARKRATTRARRRARP
ncbi:MAG TPA: hypothetical protein VGV38_12840 [Pyrinomonadaceae bacterium]|nr:hypothetical protein [Pyrinomonadaceae bacterium]